MEPVGLMILAAMIGAVVLVWQTESVEALWIIPVGAVLLILMLTGII